MKWKLNKVSRTEATIDNSGVYVIINRITETEYGKGAGVALIGIRVDIMLVEGNEPLQSFEGLGSDVRKCAIDWLYNEYYLSEQDYYQLAAGNDLIKLQGNISTEHASYIGYEIARAMQDDNYIQD